MPFNPEFPGVTSEPERERSPEKDRDAVEKAERVDRILKVIQPKHEKSPHLIIPADYDRNEAGSIVEGEERIIALGEYRSKGVKEKTVEKALHESHKMEQDLREKGVTWGRAQAAAGGYNLWGKDVYTPAYDGHLTYAPEGQKEVRYEFKPGESRELYRMVLAKLRYPDEKNVVGLTKEFGAVLSRIPPETRRELLEHLRKELGPLGYLFEAYHETGQISDERYDFLKQAELDGERVRYKDFGTVSCWTVGAKEQEDRNVQAEYLDWLEGNYSEGGTITAERLEAMENKLFEEREAHLMKLRSSKEKRKSSEGVIARKERSEERKRLKQAFWSYVYSPRELSRDLGRARRSMNVAKRNGEIEKAEVFQREIDDVNERLKRVKERWEEQQEELRKLDLEDQEKKIANLEKKVGQLERKAERAGSDGKETESANLRRDVESVKKRLEKEKRYLGSIREGRWQGRFWTRD